MVKFFSNFFERGNGASFGSLNVALKIFVLKEKLSSVIFIIEEKKSYKTKNLNCTNIKSVADKSFYMVGQESAVAIYESMVTTLENL